MKITQTSRTDSIRHQFSVENDGLVYDVVIWLDEKGKFMDEAISLNGEELEGEGEEGDVREAIVDYLDENWETLAK